VYKNVKLGDFGRVFELLRGGDRIPKFRFRLAAAETKSCSSVSQFFKGLYTPEMSLMIRDFIKVCECLFSVRVLRWKKRRWQISFSSDAVLSICYDLNPASFTVNWSHVALPADISWVKERIWLARSHCWMHSSPELSRLVAGLLTADRGIRVAG